MSWKALIDDVKYFSELKDGKPNQQVIDTALQLLEILRLTKPKPIARVTLKGTILLEWLKPKQHRFVEIIGYNAAHLYYMPEEILIEVDACLDYSYDDFLKNTVGGKP